MKTEDQREKDIQELCLKVLMTNPSRYYNPHGADEATCPFCWGKSYDVDADISEINHNVNCAYLIAKDLTAKP